MTETKESPVESNPVASIDVRRVCQGSVMPIGGAEDKDTAVVIDKEGIMEVLGSGMVTVIDGRNSVSDYFEREVGEVLTVANSHLFVLGPGRRFDLNTRQAIMDGTAA